MNCCTDTNHSGRWPTLENQSLISSFCCFSDVLLCYWQLIQWLNSGLRYWSQSTTSLLNIIYSNVASNSKISTFYIVLHAWRVCEIRSQYNKGYPLLYCDTTKYNGAQFEDQTCTKFGQDRLHFAEVISERLILLAPCHYNAESRSAYN